MTRLDWQTVGYEYGVDRGVFYPPSGAGEAWNGLVSVNEKGVDLQERVVYLDGVKRLNKRSGESFSATIQVLTYPQSFYDHLLAPLRTAPFGFSYRVMTEKGYKLHLVYNAKAQMSDQEYVHDDSKPFSFDISATPVAVAKASPTAHIVIDGAWPEVFVALEDILYGTDTADPRLPLPQELIDLFYSHAALQIVDHGDGTWTATGPDNMISMLDLTTFQIDSPSAQMLDSVTYTIDNW